MMNAKGFSKTPCTYIERLRDATFQKIVIWTLKVISYGMQKQQCSSESSCS
jgi:hypothetical protein